VTRSGRREKLEMLPLREELDALAHHYHHLRNEHERARPESAVRRELEDRLLEVRERLDRVLEEWVPDEELRDEWRAYLHNRRPEPSRPPATRPLVFQGRSELLADGLIDVHFDLTPRGRRAVARMEQEQ
jgi:hypothetical protein